MMTMPVNMRAWNALRLAFSLAIFQAAWFACVWGAASGHTGLGVAAVAAAVAVHLAMSRRRAADVILAVVAMAIGVVWDTALARAGWVVYASPGPAPSWSPLWILALWALFATTLREPLRWLHGRHVVAAALGAVGGPLSYAAAQRLGACTFPDPQTAMLVLAVGWGVVTPLLVEVARRLDRSA